MSAVRRAVPLVIAGFLAVGADAATGPTLRVNPSVAHRGDTVALSGKHWGNHKFVTLKIGLPNSDATNFIAKVETNNIGSWRGTVPVKPTARLGNYVILACRKACAIKVTKPVKIVP
jgi:hypothetical protein